MSGKENLDRSPALVDTLTRKWKGMSNKREEAQSLFNEYTRQRIIWCAASTAMHKAEEALSELADSMKPDPECFHVTSGKFGNIWVCSTCFTKVK